MIPANFSRKPVESLATLRSANRTESVQAAQQLVSEARRLGMSLRDYLKLTIDVAASENRGNYVSDGKQLNGYEAALAFLNLPVRNDIENGIMLHAAASTFQTFPGTRVLFPEVMDDVAKWKFRQTNFERVEPMLANTRTILGNEILMMVVNDNEATYQRATRAIAEGGRIPTYSIRGTDQALKIWKFGMGYETTYEFERRASIDIMTPYVQRAEREIERSKVWVATSVLINGDGAYGAAGEVNQSSFNGVVGTNSTNNKISYQHLLAWLVARAQAGFPVDTVVGNFDAYLQWLLMFAVPTSNNGETQAESLGRAGFAIRGVPILTGTVDFVLSSAAPANKLIGYSRADTLEHLMEAGSEITESERLITNQVVNYTKTENSGFRLVFGDTRQVFNFGG